jgi:hypothetical protein
MCKVVFNKTLVVGKTAWLRLETLTYLNSKGYEITAIILSLLFLIKKVEKASGIEP